MGEARVCGGREVGGVVTAHRLRVAPDSGQSLPFTGCATLGLQSAREEWAGDWDRAVAVISIRQLRKLEELFLFSTRKSKRSLM